MSRSVKVANWLVLCTVGWLTTACTEGRTLPLDPEREAEESSLATALAPGRGGNEPASMTLITNRPFNNKGQGKVPEHHGQRPVDSRGKGEDGDCVGGPGCWDSEESRAAWSIVSDPTAPAAGNRVAQQKYAKGFTGGSAPQGLAARSWPMSLEYRTIYHSFWLKLSDNFTGHLTGTNKIFHIWTQPGNVLFYSAEGRGSRGPLQFQIRLQGVPEPDTYANWQNPPNVAGRTGTEITRGKWHLFEVLLTLNTPGKKNGSFKVWQDGALTHDYSGREIVSARVTEPYWAQVQWSPTWGGSGDSVPEDMFMSIDQVYISGAR